MLKSEKEKLLYFSNVFSEVREDFCYRNGGERDEKAEKIREILTDIARYGFTSSYFGDIDTFEECKDWCKEKIRQKLSDKEYCDDHVVPLTSVGKAKKAEYTAKIYQEVAVLHKAIFIFNGFITLGEGLKLSIFLSDRMFEEVEEGYIDGLMDKRDSVEGFDEDEEEEEEEEKEK